MTSTCFIGPAQGVRKFDRSPPAEEHETEMPNPLNSAILHMFGFGLLATALELSEAGDTLTNLSTQQRPGMYNENALRPEARFKPGVGLR
jgi:hypothetical protein